MPKAKSPKTPAPQTAPAESFETDLHKLEELLTQLEHGDLPLEGALAAFEEGMQLVRRCAAKLDAVEQKVEILLRDDAGQLIARPFRTSPDADEDA